MFGLIYTAAMALGLTVSGAKAAIDNAQAMERGRERQRQGRNLQGTYYDRKGVERLLSNGKIAHVYPDFSDPCDDKWLWVGAPSKKTRNLSEELRRMQFQETKEIGDFKGRTVDVYDKRYWSTTGGNKYKVVILGTFYKDLTTGDMYVCRDFKLLYNPKTETFRPTGLSKEGEQHMNLKYYMDVRTAKLVRIADTQHTEYSRELADKFRREFNQKQMNGGWYKPDRILNSGPLQDKQDYYCDDFNSSDHIYSLFDLREKESKEKSMVSNCINKEINHL